MRECLELTEPLATALEEIGARGATLDEVLAGAGLGASPELAKQMLDAWSATCAGGDAGAFERRLAWDDLDAARVTQALQAAPATGSAGWVQWLSQFLATAALCAAEHEARGVLAEWAAPPAADEPPFVELLAPALRTARRTLTELAGDALSGFADAAIADLELQLARELAHASELGLLEFLQAFQRSRGVAGSYHGFVRAQLAAGLPLLYRELPGLARAQARIVETWCGTTAELVVRVARELPALESRLGAGAPAGRVVRVEPALSDRHDGGRRVCVLHFASGLRVAYKPRDVGAEADFHALLGWARDRGLRSLPPPLATLARDGYGFIEHAAAWACADDAELSAYHEAAGGLLFCAHLLRLRDLHNENVAAARGGPVVVDAEALGQPADASELEVTGALDRVAATRAESCLATGLLTLPQVDAGGDTYDIGGMRASPPRRAPLPRRLWHGQRTDAIGFTLDDRAPARTRSAVQRDGRVVAPEAHAAEVSRGFARAYGFFRERGAELFAADGPLATLGSRTTRLIFRPSDQYAMLLHLLDSPRYQRSGFRRSIAIDALNRVFAREERSPRLWPLTTDERAALDGRDIPRFGLPLDSTEPVAGDGRRVVGLFARSGLDAVKSRLCSLSDADLEAQLEWIGAALTPEPAHGAGFEPREEVLRSPSEAASPALFRDAALAIGEELIRRAVRGQRGFAWRGLGHGTEGALDLYDGLAGVALFLAALAGEGGGAQFDEAARGALASLQDALDGAAASGVAGGALSGSASCALALAHASRFLGEPELHRQAVALLLRPGGDQGGLDLAGGAAGRLLVAVTVGAGSEGAVTRLAILLAERLLHEQQASGGWPTIAGRADAGLSHGAAGIALALALAGERIVRDDWLASARRGFAFVEGAYDPDTGDWPLTRADGGRSVLTAWCHGAAGIALASAMLPASARDAGSEATLTHAIEKTRTARPATHDHVCCGSLGRSEALLVAGAARGQREWVEAGLQQAASVAFRVQRGGARAARPAGYESGPLRPGFFQGLAGIGHALLRASAPGRVASVLTPGAE